MNNNGFAVLIVVVIMVILLSIAFLFAVENKGLNQAIFYERREKDNTNVKYEEVNNFKDNKFYYRDSQGRKDLYILENCRMIHLDYNRFDELKKANYN